MPGGESGQGTPPTGGVLQPDGTQSIALYMVLASHGQRANAPPAA
jgi:hypothetical protein